MTVPRLGMNLAFAKMLSGAFAIKAPILYKTTHSDSYLLDPNRSNSSDLLQDTRSDLTNARNALESGENHLSFGIFHNLTKNMMSLDQHGRPLYDNIFSGEIIVSEVAVMQAFLAPDVSLPNAAGLMERVEKAIEKEPVDDIHKCLVKLARAYTMVRYSCISVDRSDYYLEVAGEKLDESRNIVRALDSPEFDKIKLFLDVVDIHKLSNQIVNSHERGNHYECLLYIRQTSEIVRRFLNYVEIDCELEDLFTSSLKTYLHALTECNFHDIALTEFNSMFQNSVFAESSSAQLILPEHGTQRNRSGAIMRATVNGSFGTPRHLSIAWGAIGATIAVSEQVLTGGANAVLVGSLGAASSTIVGQLIEGFNTENTMATANTGTHSLAVTSDAYNCARLIMRGLIYFLAWIVPMAAVVNAPYLQNHLMYMGTIFGLTIYDILKKQPNNKS